MLLYWNVPVHLTSKSLTFHVSQYISLFSIKNVRLLSHPGRQVAASVGKGVGGGVGEGVEGVEDGASVGLEVGPFEGLEVCAAVQ